MQATPLPRLEPLERTVDGSEQHLLEVVATESQHFLGVAAHLRSARLECELRVADETS